MERKRGGQQIRKQGEVGVGGGPLRSATSSL